LKAVEEVFHDESGVEEPDRPATEELIAKLGRGRRWEVKSRRSDSSLSGVSKVWEALTVNRQSKGHSTFVLQERNKGG
jgi:hypothetical protein